MPGVRRPVGREPVADQVEGHHPAVPAQGGGDGQPVEVRATEAVDEDHRGTPGWSAHVEVVGGAVHIDGP